MPCRTVILLKLNSPGILKNLFKIKKIINILMIDANSLYYDNINLTLDDYDFICRKLKNCNQYELSIIKATLNAILDKK